MFYHVKDLQFNARVSQPDPRFARVMLEAFGGANGELKSALQYFVQAFSCHNPFPDKYCHRRVRTSGDCRGHDSDAFGTGEWRNEECA